MDIRERIEQLTRRINEMANQQSAMSRQLIQLINELEALKKEASAVEEPVKTVEYREPIIAPSQKKKPTVEFPSTVRSSSTEEFIGKNIASKVGILVTIVGIFIGARYAIEHNMVSPLVRIISGYVSGLVLIGLGIFLKRKYEAYSAVLLGGGLAVLYFITYTAYGFYALMPQTVAFALMLVFTAASVYAALIYNRVIIAHLALVGAYAIPFLLSDNSGRYVILFSYIGILNAGILMISFRKNWKSLFYTAYAFTWIIYGAWHLQYYEAAHFTLAIFFLGLYFVLFYAMFLAYQLVKKEQFGGETVAILLSNAFIFYAFGYDIFSSADFGNYSGLFTTVNAAIHLGVSQLIRPRVADRALYYLVFGLTIVFVTIAIPVQFDGNWVTLLWISEAVLVFIIGRSQKIVAYEKLSVALLVLGVISLAQDWVAYSEAFALPSNSIQPFANIVFVTGLIVMAAMGTILRFAMKKKNEGAPAVNQFFSNYFVSIVAIIFLLVSWMVFYLEILVYFSHVGVDSSGVLHVKSGQIELFRQVIVLLYSMVFVGIVTWVNRKWINSEELNMASLAGIALLSLILMLTGLPALNELRSSYNMRPPDYFGSLTFTIRYIVAAVMIVLLLLGRDGVKLIVAKFWHLLIHLNLLAISSAEYLYWTGNGGDGNQYKLGLSILWSIYGLFLIVWGIYKKQKHLRLAGIVVFVVTLVKLFVYDLDEAGTLTKTISFISLGAILLLVSYLYNRYKEVMFGKDE